MAQVAKIRGQGLQENLPASVPADNLNMSAATATAVAAAVAFPADTNGRPLIISQVWWSYLGGAASGNVQITDGTTNIRVDIGVSGPGSISFTPPLAFGASSAVTMTLASGGVGITGRVAANAYFIF